MKLWDALSPASKLCLFLWQRKHHDPHWEPPEPEVDPEVVKTMTARPHYARGARGGSG